MSGIIPGCHYSYCQYFWLEFFLNNIYIFFKKGISISKNDIQILVLASLLLVNPVSLSLDLRLVSFSGRRFLL